MTFIRATAEAEKVLSTRDIAQLRYSLTDCLSKIFATWEKLYDRYIKSYKTSASCNNFKTKTITKIMQGGRIYPLSKTHRYIHHQQPD